MANDTSDTVMDTQWARVRARLRSEIGEAAYQSWLKPMTPRDTRDGTVRLSVPTRFMRDWVEAHYAERIRDLWKEGHIDTLHVPIFEDSLVTFSNIQGGCERIKNTPVPIAYTMLTHRIVGIYCLALPWGVIDTVGVYTPIVVVMVSFAFLGLDGVGSQIEDPFEEDPNDLPLLALSRTIEIDLKQRIGEAELPDPIPVVDGILY